MTRQHCTASLVLPVLCYAGNVTGANDEAVATGLGNVGPASIVFAVAAALLLTLLFRRAVSQVTGTVTRYIGTRRVRRVLRQRSNNILSDFLLPGAYGGLTRVDHAILTAGGVLCIQTKHYSGVVFGSMDEPQWTNVDGVQRRKFLNPLIQNEGRTRALRNVLPDIPVDNVVVFTGDVQFTSPLQKNVIHVRDLDAYIAKFVFGPCKVKDWDATWMSVKAAALLDDDSRKDFDAQLSFS